MKTLSARKVDCEGKMSDVIANAVLGIITES